MTAPTPSAAEVRMELKNCPFCAEQPLTIEWKEEADVYCANPLCFARPKVRQMTIGKAIAAWNRRPSDSVKAELVEALRGARVTLDMVMSVRVDLITKSICEDTLKEIDTALSRAEAGG